MTTGRQDWRVKRMIGGAVLLASAALAVGLVLHVGSAPAPAFTQIPDSGAQRAAMLQELRALNEKLATMVELLRDIRDGRVGTPPAAKAADASDTATQPLRDGRN